MIFLISYHLLNFNSYAKITAFRLFFLVILFKSVTNQKSNCLFTRIWLNKEAPHIEKLIEECRIGSRSAQFEIYKLYYKAMFNTAYRMVNDSFIAEDIMQEVFLSAFTKLDSFSGDVTFGAWLKRIVINRTLTEIKKNSRMNMVPIEKADVDTYEDADENYQKVEPKMILEKISGLKSNYKVALTLHLIEGYDYKEVAQIMEISYENTRTTISRAKNSLRKALTHWNERQTRK